MKTKALFLILITLPAFLCAQSWSRQAERITGKPKTTTVLLKPGFQLNIGILDTSNDTLKEGRYFQGVFLRGSHDSLAMKLTSVKEVRSFTAGVNYSKVIPGTLYLKEAHQDTNLLQIATANIDYLLCYKPSRVKMEPGAVLLLGSLAVMVLSPLICYDYKEQELNANRYKYWAMGSTAGALAGFAILITNGGNKTRRLQFQPDWPDKNMKVWKFR